MSADATRSAARRRGLPGPEAARGHLAMFAFSGLVAGSFALGGMAAPLIDPMALTALRFAIAAGVMGAIVWGRGYARRVHFAAPWRYLVLGGLFAIYFTAMFEGLKTASPVSTAAVFTLTPVMSAGFGWLLLGQVMTRRMGLALAIAAAGAVWVIFNADWAAMLAFRIGRGETIFFFGCIAHALYTPMVPRLRREEPLTVLTLGMMIAGFGLLAVAGLPAILATGWTSLPGIVWVTVLYIAVVASALTFFLVQYAALRLPSAKVMAYTYLTPAWVILWQGGLGQGWPPPAIVAGVGLVVVGLVLLLKE